MRSRERHVSLHDSRPPLGTRVATLQKNEMEVRVLSFPIIEHVPPTLTAVERAIALAVLEGKTNAEIAVERRRSIHTIGNQVAALFRKLGVGSRLELALRLAEVDLNT